VTPRALSYTLSRPRVLIPAIIGVALLLGGGWKVAGFVLLGIAFVKASRLLGGPDLDRQLELRDARRNHGVWRQLFPTEQAELAKLEAYGNDLVASGADRTLAREALTEGWRIVARAGERDATSELRAFRQTLPPLVETAVHTAARLGDKIRAELELLRATRKEVDAAP
jgi:hypothetical protein